MGKRLSVFSAFVVTALLVAVAQPAAPQAAQTGAAIKVALHYTGSGTVDENHKIYVALWDSAAFPKGNAMPIAVESASSKTGTVTFSDVKANPAYVSAAFDPSGKWDAQSGPPPTGSSLGMYSKTPGTPEPINTASGKTLRATIDFDDSVKVP